MISKSKEETEVSCHFEEYCLEAGVWVKLANSQRSLLVAKAAAWPDIHLREPRARSVHEV
jgi:hypothetical protein